MGGVNDRRTRPTLPFDSQSLARLAEQGAASGSAAPPDEELDEAFSEWDEEPTGPAIARSHRIATGTSPPELRARTSTMHDPLTTSVLAEVARRAHTIEVTPEQVDEAIALDGPADANADPDQDPPIELTRPRRST